uniref:Ras-related protein Rab-24 n=1 Tax=Caligus rogercresseyi TaxID=217165 RepID=C1BMZ3_CALRO|nr:Ras-related protein Rab-24 [Caligus rogercresseyi]|eukprot:TRINITY_DN10993_c0_g1_i1.p1 TRINITY_DN10993_c0_g1~~TRINITY_DN10993_c0_g1_i1.p1  ORF type:complete len:242 (+),score=47.44 TRINITY_DN10993_c0_g1_i1:121-846(+)
MSKGEESSRLSRMFSFFSSSKKEKEDTSVRRRINMTPNFKVVTLGEYGCGKTSLVQAFMRGRNIQEGELTATIDAIYSLFTFPQGPPKMNQEISVMGLWDTAGAERYNAISRMYYRGAFAAVVCFDVTNFRSWTRLRSWVEELLLTDVRIYIVGCKKDLRKRVCTHTAAIYAEAVNATYFETSSRTGTQVEEVFNQIYTDFLDYVKAKSELLSASEGDGGSSSIQLHVENEAPSSFQWCSC